MTSAGSKCHWTLRAQDADLERVIYLGNGDWRPALRLDPIVSYRARRGTGNLTASSGRFVNYATICAGHGSVTNYIASLEQSHSDVTTFTFNNTPVSIVVTPYVAPTV